MSHTYVYIYIYIYIYIHVRFYIPSMQCVVICFYE